MRGSDLPKIRKILHFHSVFYVANVAVVGAVKVISPSIVANVVSVVFVSTILCADSVAGPADFAAMLAIRAAAAKIAKPDSNLQHRMVFICSGESCVCCCNVCCKIVFSR